MISDPCADKFLTKTRTGHRTVRTNLWKISGPNFDGLDIQSGQKLGSRKRFWFVYGRVPQFQLMYIFNQYKPS